MKTRKKGKTLLFDFLTASTKLEKSIVLDLDSHPHTVYKDDYLTTHGSTFEYYRKVQASACLKKYADPGLGVNHERQEKTYEKFRNVHDHMSGIGSIIRSQLPGSDERVLSTMCRSRSVLLRARAVVKQLLTPFSTEEWFAACKNSKGSSIGVPFRDTSLEKKFTYPLSCTSRVVPFFNMYLDFDPRLKSAITENNLNGTTPVREMYNVVEGSRATTVPKDETIDRMIAIEPTLNMFFQQGLMEMMYDRMADMSLDVNSLPSIHKKLARESSLSSLNATIDFSSASDCVSYEFMKWLLPPAWFGAIDMCRSPSISLNGELIDLDIISTMGNAVTFPLETIVFFALGHAVVLEDTGTNSTLPEWRSLKSVSVFGDDCIIPTRLAPRFIEVCESVGFMVNKEKSFYKPEDEGFRESCGGDYLHGYDVRPFHVKGAVSTRLSSLEPWIYTCINKILPKYMTYFGERDYLYGRSAIRYLFELLKKHGILAKVVPSDFPEDSGILDNGDLRRLFKHYCVEASPIYTNEHGTLRFNFIRYIYPEKLKRCEYLRYATWMKNPSISADEAAGVFDTFVRSVRRGGSYVVGVSRSSHWTCSL